MNATDPDFDVLLVDDSDDVLRLLARELRGAGLRVRCAASGEDALAQIEADRPEVVLLDVKMGGIDGFETCSRIRRRHDDLPVVFMTGLGETEHVVQGFAVGASDFVTKPVRAPEVIARLGAHARTARLVRATREAADALDLPMMALAEDRLLWLNGAVARLLGRCGLDARGLVDGPVPALLAPLRTLQHGARQLTLRLGLEVVQASRINEPSAGVCVVLLRPADAPARPGRPAGAGAAGRPSASPGACEPAPLTARESEVLVWVARGKTNRDIAEILGMSPRTVNKHLEHIFEKLGVETRTAAAAAAHRLRIDA